MPQLTVSADYTVLTTDDVIFVDVSTNPVTLTFPVAHSAGMRWTVKHKLGDAEVNTITIQGSGGDTIDVSPTYVFSTNRQSVNVESDGTNFVLL